MSTLVTDTLKINKVSHTNGTTAFEIDSNGYIINPTKPMFNARANGTASSFTSGTEVTYFTNALVNLGGNYNTSNCRFTAPVNGYYFFFVNVLSNASSNIIDFRLAKNGSYIQGGWSSDYNGFSQANGGLITNLNVGDYVSIYSVNSSGVWWGDATHSYWMGFLI